MTKYVVHVRASNGLETRYELFASSEADARGVVEKMLAKERAEGWTITGCEVAG